MLSKKSKYAILALIHLAKKKNQGPIMISRISEEENIPKKFLEGILFELKNSGIVTSQRGRSGGYYLIKNPEDVNLAQIMRLFEGPIALIPCVTYMYYAPCPECRDEKTCSIRAVFKDVRDQTVEILKSATLEEMMKKEEMNIKK